MQKTTSFWADHITPTWLPDWLDESEYSRLESSMNYNQAIYADYSELPSRKHCTRIYGGGRVKASKSDFAWEFLRRNPEYQVDYARLIELAVLEGVVGYYKKSLGLNIFDISYRDLPISSMKFHAELYRSLRKWGLSYYLLDPSFDMHDTAPLGGVKRSGNDCYPAMRLIYVPTTDGAGQEPIPIDGGIIPGETEIFWLFDVSLPVEDQLARAKKFLEGKQKSFYGKKLQASSASNDIGKLATYLRILDADAQKADDKEIINVLFPEKKGITYIDSKGKLYEKVSTRKSPARVILADWRKGAYALMQRGYKALL